MIEWFEGITKDKDPEARLNYKFRWADWLVTGETISSHQITVSSGLTLVGSQVVDADTAVSVQIDGGTAGSTYTVECKITDTSGQIDERTLKISVVEL